MRQLASAHPVARGWRIDSAGTGAWHIGKPADPRTLATLARHGVPCDHRARQVQPDDFRRYDRLVAMDRQNVGALALRRPADGSAVVDLLAADDGEGTDEVPDPYHGGEADFEAVFAQIERCCRAFIARHG